MTSYYDALIHDYSYLHAMTNYGRCPNDKLRAKAIELFLATHMVPGQSVLDCSAGRGHLLHALTQRGLVCTATEADPYLVEHDLAPFAPQLLRYDELDTLAPEKWDAVVSCEVLEHLLTEDEVRAALRAMAALSRRWLCVTVGLTRSGWHVEGSRWQELHYVVRDADWWSAEVRRVATIVEEHANYSSWLMFAEVTYGSK